MRIASSLLCVFRWGHSTEPIYSGHAQHPPQCVQSHMFRYDLPKCSCISSCAVFLFCTRNLASPHGYGDTRFFWWKVKSCSGWQPPATDLRIPSSVPMVWGIEWEALKCYRPGGLNQPGLVEGVLAHGVIWKEMVFKVSSSPNHWSCEAADRWTCELKISTEETFAIKQPLQTYL